MKTIEFEIPIFDMDVCLIQVESSDDADKVVGVCAEYDLTDDIIEEIRYKIEEGDVDGGTTYTNRNYHTGVIIFYKMKNEDRKLVCYSHEKRHLEDRLLEFCNIDDRETAAYVAGYLALYFKKLYDNSAPINNIENKH